MKKMIVTFLFAILSSVPVLARKSALEKVSETIFTVSVTPISTTSDILNVSGLGLNLNTIRREQVVANLQQIAVLNQTYTPQFNELIKSTRIALAEEVGVNQVAEMTDQEVLASVIK